MSLRHTFWNALKVSALALVLAGGVSYINAANITAPTCAPPGCNAAAPVNVSIADQTKNGPLTLSQNALVNGVAPDGVSSLAQGLSIVNGRFAVGTLTTPASLKGLFVGNVGATAYCNEAGTTCLTIDQLQDLINNLSTSTAVPTGAMMAFDGACPTGWIADTKAQGRYIVGTPAGGGQNGLEIGTELTNGENRPAGQHAHRVQTTTVGGGGHGEGSIGLFDPAANSTRDTTGIIGGAVSGTNAPYVQYTWCKKQGSVVGNITFEARKRGTSDPWVSSTAAAPITIPFGSSVESYDLQYPRTNVSSCSASTVRTAGTASYTSFSGTLSSGSITAWLNFGKRASSSVTQSKWTLTINCTDTNLNPVSKSLYFAN